MLESLRRVGVVCAACAVVAAQDAVFEELPLRVSSLRPGGACVVDRGKRDLLQVGDRVVLAPRNGQVVPGTVTEVEDRTALVQLIDPTIVLALGTRGHALVPQARRAAAQPTPPPAEPTEPAPGQATEEEWKPGMPLLGTTRPPRPAERPASFHGRLYTAANAVRTLDSWRQSYLVSGLDSEFDNINGDGGTLRLHGEFDWSTETSEVTGTDIRIYDFSYERGGNRFQPWRYQVGRFLQRDMPEFGILDGVEVGYRREGSDRFGASFGWLPELDEDLESWADMQVAAWYIWNQDVAERVSVGIGYQKSWHRFDRDRDLVVVKARYLPVDGWDTAAAVWVDFYGGEDVLKDETFEITRANALVARRWVKEGGLELLYDHEEYPEMIREELPQSIAPQTLIDAHQDRVSMHAWVYSGESTRWFTRLTGWVDQTREGGSGEIGVEVTGLLAARARTVLAVFDLQGLAQSLAGVRVEHGGNFSYGRLDLLYELGFVHHEGFPNDRDDLLQHRLATMLTTDLGASWNSTFFADATLWDEELSFGLGIWLQKHF